MSPAAYRSLTRLLPTLGWKASPRAEKDYKRFVHKSGGLRIRHLYLHRDGTIRITEKHYALIKTLFWGKLIESDNLSELKTIMQQIGIT